MDTPLRIGIWFDSRHCSFGGPTSVLLGTILGLFQNAERTKRPIVILLNEPGDVNWIMSNTEHMAESIQKAQDPLIGPLCFSFGDAELDPEAYKDHIVWKYGTRYIVASEWFKAWISYGLPFRNPSLAGHRTLSVWEAGVDTDRFRPSEMPPKQDYFIYFKSQQYDHLQTLHTYLFHNYFGYRGSVLLYYNYDPAMLAELAANSRFCIMLDLTETQGLAALEIMACNCPLFVLDYTVYSGQKFSMQGATSVTCWDKRCGMKSSFDTLETDFPVFLEKLPSYRPREFVCESYSFERAAHTLRDLLSREHH